MVSIVLSSWDGKVQKNYSLCGLKKRYDSNCYGAKGWICRINKGIDPNINAQINVTDTFDSK